MTHLKITIHFPCNNNMRNKLCSRTDCIQFALGKNGVYWQNNHLRFAIEVSLQLRTSEKWKSRTGIYSVFVTCFTIRYPTVFSLLICLYFWTQSALTKPWKSGGGRVLNRILTLSLHPTLRVTYVPWICAGGQKEKKKSVTKTSVTLLRREELCINW